MAKPGTVDEQHFGAAGERFQKGVELVEQLYQMAMETQGGPGDSPVARGGNSMTENGQPMATPQGGQGMRGKAPQRQRGGAPAKPGVPMKTMRMGVDVLSVVMGPSVCRVWQSCVRTCHV